MKRLFIILSVALASTLAISAIDHNKVKVEKPDLAKIKAETTNEASEMYYPKLMKSFLSNDTLLTPEEYRYLYYGALFQEDYNPYRASHDSTELRDIEVKLYYKQKHTNDERKRIEQYARAAIANNPLDIWQLSKLIYVYEQKGKVNLAKIWKHKLNHLLYVIASSGTGADPENAWIVVYPRHEYDFLNLSGITGQSSEFVPPYYEHITIQKKSDKDPEGYFFNIKDILDQYYLKHPMELDDEDFEDTEDLEDNIEDTSNAATPDTDTPAS